MRSVHTIDTTPAYLRLGLDELRARVHRAVEGLADCRFCPRDCGVNRLEDKWSACKTGRHALVGSHFPHFGEEDCLRGWNGSGTIFFSHCNLRCVFCFAPGTRIATDQGFVPIEHVFDEGKVTGRDEIRRIDGRRRVITREGRAARVAKAFRHRFAGELVRVKPYRCPPLLLTPNHELFVAPEHDTERIHKIAAGCLTRKHRLVVPIPERRDEEVTLEVAEILGGVSIERRRSPRSPSHELVTLFGQRWSSSELAQITGYHPAYVRKLRGRWRRGDFGHEADDAPGRSLAVEDGKVRFAYEHRPGIPLRMCLD